MPYRDFVHYENGVKVIERFKNDTKPPVRFGWLGMIGTVVSVLSVMFFIGKTIVKRETLNIAYWWIAAGLISGLCWLIYGWANKLEPSIISSTLAILGYVYLLLLKLFLERNGLAAHQQMIETPMTKV